MIRTCFCEFNRENVFDGNSEIASYQQEKLVLRCRNNTIVTPSLIFALAFTADA